MQVAVDQGQISVMWIVDGNTFVGKGSQIGSYSQVSLFELSVRDDSSSIEIAGGGTGSKTEIAGGGTGIEIAGGGTGIEIAGGGTGGETIIITLPRGVGLQMEVILGCDTATVSVLDSTDYSEVITFNNVKVMGDTGLCQSENDGEELWYEDSYR